MVDRCHSRLLQLVICEVILLQCIQKSTGLITFTHINGGNEPWTFTEGANVTLNCSIVPYKNLQIWRFNSTSESVYSCAFGTCNVENDHGGIFKFHSNEIIGEFLWNIYPMSLTYNNTRFECSDGVQSVPIFPIIKTRDSTASAASGCFNCKTCTIILAVISLVFIVCANIIVCVCCETKKVFFTVKVVVVSVIILVVAHIIPLAILKKLSDCVDEISADVNCWVIICIMLGLCVVIQPISTAFYLKVKSHFRESRCLTCHGSTFFECSCKVGTAATPDKTNDQDTTVPTQCKDDNETNVEEYIGRRNEELSNQYVNMHNFETSKTSITELNIVPIHAKTTEDGVTVIWDNDTNLNDLDAMIFWKPHIQALKEDPKSDSWFETDDMQQSRESKPQNLPELIRIYILPDWIGREESFCKSTHHLHNVFSIRRRPTSGLLVFVYWKNEQDKIIAKSEEKNVLPIVPILAKLTENRLTVSWNWKSLLNADSATLFYIPRKVITEKKKQYRSHAKEQNTPFHQNVPDDIRTYDLPDWIYEREAVRKVHTCPPLPECVKGNSSLMIFVYWKNNEEIIAKSDEIERFQRVHIHGSLTKDTLTVKWNYQPDENNCSAIVFYKPIMNPIWQTNKKTRNIDQMTGLPIIYRNDKKLSVHAGELDYEHDFVHRLGFPEWLDEDTSSCEILHSKDSCTVKMKSRSNVMVFVYWKNSAGVLLAISDEISIKQ